MERESSKAARESIRPRTAANIFLVDDDNEGLSWLDALLQRWGVEIVRYASAEQFLESLVAGQSGVLIVEMDLPGMSGLELHRTLVKRGYRLPTIVVATNGDVPLAVQALKEGAADFLDKPVVPQILLHRVRQALALTDQPPSQ